MDGRFWLDGAVDTIHVRNLTENPACVLHLEDGQKAVIVEGRSEAAVSSGSEFGGRLAAEFSAKYDDAALLATQTWLRGTDQRNSVAHSLRPDVNL